MGKQQPYAYSHTGRRIVSMATTVRVSETTRRRAASLAREAGTSIGELVDQALDTYESKQFWSKTQAALVGRAATDSDGWDAVDRDGLDRD